MENNNIYLFIGNRIKELRISKGLKQEDIAKALGVNANEVSRWETATYKPAIVDICNLSELFDVPINDFFNIRSCRKELHRGDCCCNCNWHKEDFQHCITVNYEHDNCVCNQHKGWICFPPDGRAHSGWPEHGICEMHKLKEE